MEEMVMMMATSSPEHSTSETTISIDPITTSTCPSWKLYENPFYNSHHHHQHQHQPHQHQQQCQSSSNNNKQLHCLHLPLSARKLAASFWDLTFFKPIMESEMDYTRAQIIELKSELEYEHKARKKLEHTNKRLAKELAEERRGREAIERVCEELAAEINYGKAEICRMKKEMEEERKMLRVAEVLREERVQMKLTEAKFLFEEKLLELEGSNNQMHSTTENSHSKTKDKSHHENVGNDSVCSVFTTTTRPVLSEKAVACSDINGGGGGGGGFSSMAMIQRRASPEPENPHIKRGIKGFVEFPRVVRAIGSKSRHWGTKLECQKAQLRILLKQKSPIRSNSLIMS